LAYTGTGASTIEQVGNATSISGNIAAGQTLNMYANATNGYAIVDSTAAWTNAGTINLDNGSTGGYYPRLDNTSGALTNTGTINVNSGETTASQLNGSVNNKGMIHADVTLTMSGGTFTDNTGSALAIANGVLVTASENVSNDAGTIDVTGTGELLETSGTFTQGGGTTSGSATTPVVVQASTALAYTGTGASTIEQVGNATSISGNIAAGQTLNLYANASNYAFVESTAAWTNAGTINLNSAAGTSYYPRLDNTSGALTNTGTINALPAGTTSVDDELLGNVTNGGVIDVSAGTTLQHQTGVLTEKSTGTFETNIASATSFGVLSDSATPVLAGNLAVHTVGSFVPTVGQTYTIISAASVSGKFANGGVADGNLLYQANYDPTASPTSVVLVVTQPSLVVTPSTSGPPGTAITITGNGWGAGDSIKVTFKDHAGVKTVYATVVADSSGHFSINENIPAGAATGAGTVKAKDLIVQDKAKVTYTVT
jgi:hypothetical protein